jgi:hypothetical protein
MSLGSAFIGMIAMERICMQFFRMVLSGIWTVEHRIAQCHETNITGVGVGMENRRISQSIRMARHVLREPGQLPAGRENIMDF